MENNVVVMPSGNQSANAVKPSFGDMVKGFAMASAHVAKGAAKTVGKVGGTAAGIGAASAVGVWTFDSLFDLLDGLF